jgi:hypothetical protein
MQSMMYPHFVFTQQEIEFSVIDLVCCSNDDIGNESGCLLRKIKELQNARRKINFHAVETSRSCELNENNFLCCRLPFKINFSQFIRLSKLINLRKSMIKFQLSCSCCFALPYFEEFYLIKSN